jgi:hypothetical protein
MNPNLFGPATNLLSLTFIWHCLANCGFAHETIATRNIDHHFKFFDLDFKGFLKQMICLILAPFPTGKFLYD